METSRPAWLVYGAVAAIGAGLVYYSQTAAFAWDEGFHLLAAQLIKAGKRPYADFFFAQAPLNAYLNACWMSLFGESWRVPHAADAVLSWAGVFLVAQFVWTRFPCPAGWRAAAAVVAAVSVGLNAQFVEFSTLQAYGPALFFSVVAFRMIVLRRYAFVTGVLAGAAAGCTLLAAPVPLVLLVWMWIGGGEAPRRLRPSPKVLLFVAGAIVPFIPVLVLLVQAPGPTFFDLLKYHTVYRREGWGAEPSHDFSVLTAWINSGQALLLFLLAAAALGAWSRLRSELRLCAWLSLAMIVHLSTARPTFERYYLLVTPYMSILAAAGFVTVSSKFASRPLWPAVAYIVLIAIGLGKVLYDDWDDFRWRDLKPVARKVAEVAPPGSAILADEHVYFLAKRQPPSGMEYADSHKLKLPPAMARSLHVVPQSEVERWVKAGLFSTVETCDDDMIKNLGLKDIYRNSAEIGDCHVFWNHRP